MLNYILILYYDNNFKFNESIPIDQEREISLNVLNCRAKCREPAPLQRTLVSQSDTGYINGYYYDMIHMYVLSYDRIILY